MNGTQQNLSTVEDLAYLETLDDDVLLLCLKQRFQNSQFYTYIGDVLVAINPCEQVPLYGEEFHRKYKDLRVRKNEPPHVFWAADYAYRNLLDTRLQQCIVVNGDSGAGKTENTKYALKHLIHISPCQAPDLVDKILRVNPLIELFGNASTIFNKNSSRFGKLIELSYLPNGTLLGAKLQTFVFEKSRVIHHGVGEKNFHVFHAMFAGIDEEKLLYYFIENPNNYRILQEDNALFHKSTGTFRNAEEQQEFSNIFQEGMAIFRQIGFSDNDIYQMIQVLAAVLHVGNIEFVEDEEIPEAVTIKEERHIKYAADNLQIQNTDRLVQALISKPRYIRGERVESFKTLRQADDGKDALAKELYKSLFDGIIERINQALKPSGSHLVSDGQNMTIGILDISGFENLRMNSFEQLLINVTNERLHQYFQQQVFESERNDYHMEGVAATDVHFKDNDDVLDLLFRRPGIIPVLEEELSVPGSTDKTLVLKYNKYFRNSPAYQQSKQENMFLVRHYAGKVKYCADGFLEKNKGTLADNLRMCFIESNNMFIRNHFCDNGISQLDDSFYSSVSSRGSLSKESARRIRAKLSATETSEGSHTNGEQLHDSVTSQYKKSLHALNDRLSKAKPLFIRCIKPNVDLAMGTFDERIVKSQLKSCGVLEVTKIRKEGFPVRMKIEAFLHKFQDTWKYLEGDDKAQAETILRQSCVSSFKIGKTKIFMKADGLDQIERKVAEIKEEQEKRRIAEHQRVHRNSVTHTTPDSDPSSDTASLCSEVSSSLPVKDRKITPPPSYTSVQGLDDISKEDTLSTKVTNEPEPLPAWDIFRITERETEESSVMEERCLMFARFVVYILMFLGILATGMGSIFGLLTITSNLKSEAANEGQYVTEIIVCFSVPVAVTFFVSLGKILFGRKEKLQFKYCIMVLFLDSLQTVGVGFLVFKFLPFHNTVIGIIFLMAPLQFPSLFNIHRAVSRKRGWKFKQRLCVMIISLLALVIQWAFPTVVFTTDKMSFVDPDIQHSGLVVISLCLVSCGWCHIFFGDNVKSSKLSLNFQLWRTEVLKSRDNINLLTCPVKVGLFFLMAYRMYPEATIGLSLSSNIVQKSVPVANSTEMKNVSAVVYESIFVEYSTLIIQVVSSLLCTYLCALACKIKMQRLAFSLPLVLVSPCAICLTLLGCWFDKNEVINILEGRLVCPKMTVDDLITPIGSAFGLLLSIIFSTWYIWFPSSERMAKTEKLFELPVHDGIFSALSMLLRRKDDMFESHLDKHHQHDSEKRKKKKKHKPYVNICATMWHESRVEMLQLLKSLFRLDKYHSQNKLAEAMFDVERDYFDLTNDKSKQRIPNEYVQQLVECIDEAVMSVAKGRISWEKNPKKISTPYGGRLEWTMPGGTKMIFHLKDKTKTRHRKRWSQILYLYYLLGFELMGTGKEDDVLRQKSKRRRPIKPFTSLLNQVPPDKLKQAYNTYILTLDGDVDFRPEAVKLLIDRMTKNDKVAAVCGRIHPIGSGPMVWYQQFEYAVGHWLQKATEHVFGCVLCCPGCFSLFRFAALIDDNVVKMYTTAPTEARHYIQFEQGEDRWLCTLLLQQGWKIDYCAGADSFTYAPETFKEFFIQRRRWAPSTMANLMDLLASWKSTVKVNDNISTPFIFYQFILMASSLLGPGTVTLMIAGSYSSVFGIDMYYGFLIAMTPVVLFIIVCLKAKNDTQIYIAGLLSSVYCIVMVIVTVGTLLNILEEDFLSPNVVFLASLGIIFSLAGIWHPKEIGCLIYGILYYLTVPSTFIFLTIYFLCNVNVVSWGTREAPKKLTEEEEEEKRKEIEEKARKKREGGSFCRALGISNLIQEISSIIRQSLGGNSKDQTASTQSQPSKEIQNNKIESTVSRHTNQDRPLPIPEPARTNSQQEFEIDPTYWGQVDFLGNEKASLIEESEEIFWKDIIAKYLYPIVEDKDKQEQIKNDLRELRNNVVFGYFLMNLLFTIAIFQLQVNEEKLRQFFILGLYEPLSLAFLAVFATVLVLQFIGMFLHRWGTFLHLISSTQISVCAKGMDEHHYSEEAFREVGRLQNADPDPHLLEGLETDTASSSVDSDTLPRPSIMEPDYPDYEEFEGPHEQRLDSIEERQVDIEEMSPDYPEGDDDLFSDNFPHLRHEPGNAYEKNFSRRIETLRQQFRLRNDWRNGRIRQPEFFHNNDNSFGRRSINNLTRRQELYYRTIGRRHFDRNMQHL